MLNRLRDVLFRVFASLAKRRGLIAVKTEHDEENRGWAERRARFWTEFRQGQREAEAHRSRP
jgi:hypothetical protein